VQWNTAGADPESALPDASENLARGTFFRGVANRHAAGAELIDVLDLQTPGAFLSLFQGG
jgi:hypothetical protein